MIKASPAGKINALLVDLRSTNPVVRETASAQLTVIGPRAVDTLLTATADPSPSTRIAVVRTLEAIADPRGLPAILAAIGDPDVSVALGAVDAARAFLRGEKGADVVERLTTLALDLQRQQSIRVAAVQALTALGPASVKPLLDALPPDLRHAAASLQTSGLGDGDDPAAFRDTATREDASLTDLLAVVTHAREREQSSVRPEEWVAIRGAAHVALAKRGSLLALFDLKESLESAAGPLPADFLGALVLVGDASTLQSIAAAYARADRDRGTRGRHAVWRDELSSAFAAIVKRTRATKRHSAAKQIEKRWPGVLNALWPR